MRIGFLITLASLIIIGYIQAANSAQQSRLADTLLAAIPQPDPGQFPRPESVVRFLLTQIEHQDIDQAMRVFPVREHHEHASFEVVAKDTRTFFLDHTPIPSADLHNLMLALRPLTDFYRLSLALLGVEPDTFHQVEDVSTWAKKLDLNQLRGLKVKKLHAEHCEQFPPDRQSPYHRAMGISEICLMAVVAESACCEVHFSVRTDRLEDNWRITQISGFDIERTSQSTGN